MSRHHTGFRIRYHLYYPDGSHTIAYAYRTHRPAAREVQRLATELEGITRQNALTPDLAVTFQHHRLLRDADLRRWFPGRDTLAFDPQTLLKAYERQCETQMTSASAIYRNLLRAGHLIERLGNLSTLDVLQLRRWQAQRAGEVSRRTTNLDLDVLRQLGDLCMEQGWQQDNPARAVKKLPEQRARLPQALTYDQVSRLLAHAQACSKDAVPTSLAGQCYRLVVAGLYLGLRRGELQHLLVSDTDGRQVLIQGKRLPDGREWLPKSRVARVIRYPGIVHPIQIVWDALPSGYVFSPSSTNDRPFQADSLTEFMTQFLRPIAPGCSLHAFRHTFISWRLYQSDSLLHVKGMAGHSTLTTMSIYAHLSPDPAYDLLALLP